MTILAVFRSRGQCLDFAGRLYKYGVSAQTAPAPKEAKIGCGLCLKFDISVLPKARAVLGLGKYTSFKGFYTVGYVDGRLAAVPYYG